MGGPFYPLPSHAIRGVAVTIMHTHARPNVRYDLRPVIIRPRRFELVSSAATEYRYKDSRRQTTANGGSHENGKGLALAATVLSHDHATTPSLGPFKA